MVWFKVDDGLPTSRKILSIPRSVRLSAVGLWTLAGAWSAGEELDGHVPDYMVTELGGTPRLVDALILSGLWVQVADGAQFSKWAEWQPTRAELESARRKETERKRRYRERGNPAGVPPGRDVGRDLVSGHPDPTRPDPTLKDSSSTKKSLRRKPEIALPADWKPSAAHVVFARERGVDGRHEEAQFRAHAAANDRRQRDWDAAFRVWLGNARPAGRRSKEEQVVDVLEQGRLMLEQQGRKALE